MASSSRRTTPGRSRPGGRERTRGPARAGPAGRRTSRTVGAEEARADTGVTGVTGRAAVLLLVLLALAVSYVSSTRAWLDQRSEISALNAEITSRQAAIAAMEQERRRLRDPAYIKTLGRLRFGFVLPGEVGFRVIGADGEVLSTGRDQLGTVRPPAPRREPAWWETQWASLRAAGRTPEQVAAQRTRAEADEPLTRIGQPSPRGGPAAQPR